MSREHHNMMRMIFQRHDNKFGEIKAKIQKYVKGKTIKKSKKR